MSAGANVKVSANSSTYQQALKAARDSTKELASQFSLASTQAKLFGSTTDQTFAQLQKTEAEMATADAVAIATKRTKKVLKDDYLTKKETEVKISALAESIELEVSKTYMTVANGQAAIDKALEAGKQYTDGKLTEYSTTEATKSLITQSAEQITLEVSKTYATTASVEKSLDTLQAAAKSAQETADKANSDAADAQAAADKAAADAAAAAAEADKAKQAAADAETNAAADAQEKANAAQAAAEKAAAADAQAKAAAAEAAAKKAAAEDATAKANAAQEAANKYTDTQLTKYSTTEEMKSAISQSATGITLEVSKTYATKTSVEESVATLQAAAKSAQETADKANSDAADAQAAADKAAADAAAAAAEADKAKQAAADAETNAAADAQEKANAAQAAAEKAAAADAQAKAAAAEAAAKQAAAADAKKKADAAKKEAQDYTDGKLTEYSTTDEMKSAIKATRFVSVLIVEDGKEYAPPADADLIANFQKPDGKFAYNAAKIDDGNRILVELTNQVLAVPGEVVCEVEIRAKDSSQVLTSCTFTVKVGRSNRKELKAA